jgi:hypothetical protein
LQPHDTERLAGRGETLRPIFAANLPVRPKPGTFDGFYDLTRGVAALECVNDRVEACVRTQLPDHQGG